MAKIAIVGSRDYPNMSKVRLFVGQFSLSDVLVSGGARGVDSQAEETARRMGMQVEIYRADWDRHGKTAGYIRNKLIVDAADRVIAFWDGQSRGTMHTIRLAKLAGKLVRVYGSDGRPMEDFNA